MVPTKIFLSLEDARLLLKHLPSPLELSGDHPRGKHASTSICTPERHTTQFRKGFLGFMQSYKVAWFFRRFHSCLRVFCAKYRKENTPPEPIFFFLLHLIQMTKSCIRQLQKIDESIFKNASIPPPYTRTCVNVCARAQTHVCFLTRVISNSHWSSYLENVESAWDFFFFSFEKPSPRGERRHRRFLFKEETRALFRLLKIMRERVTWGMQFWDISSGSLALSPFSIWEALSNPLCFQLPLFGDLAPRP